MAKKKDIANLINGIVGEPQQKPQPGDNTAALDSEVVERLGITPDLEEKLNQVRRENVGRPKGKNRQATGVREARATFVVHPDLVRKVKYIALMDSRLLKDVVAEALNAYIEKWEKSHQVINLPNNKKQ